jgi:ParB family chromosome partitioning protein
MMARKRNRITAEMSQTIAESSPLIKKTKTISVESSEENTIIDININNLIPNPFQPRIDINVQSLNELISSIEQNGLLQPIIATKANENGIHTIVAGHRRYEAHKIMGKSTIKSLLIKDYQDKDLAILSLTENLMREDLHPIENAIAIKNILDNNIVESQNKLAEFVGLSKGYVSKLLNLLKLPTNVIKTIKDEHYKDINILIMLNKLQSESQMLEVFHAIKKLTRADAEKYIKNKYFTKNESAKSIVDIKASKSKISLDIDIKKLSKEQLEIITSKVETLNQEIIKLSNEWIK